MDWIVILSMTKVEMFVKTMMRILFKFSNNLLVRKLKYVLFR